MAAPLVLLHPMWYDSRFWEPVLPHLTAPTTAVDLPGFGTAPGPFTADRAIAAARAAIDAAAAEFGEPVDLLGLSMGARVALAAAAADHAGIRSLILLGIGDDVSPVAARVQRIALRLMGRRLAESMGGAPTAEPSRAAAAAFPDLPVRSAAARVAVPTLVVAGGEDREFRGSCETVAGLIPGSRLQIVPGAEHLWPRERPEDFATLLGRWREERDAASAVGPEERVE